MNIPFLTVGFNKNNKKPWCSTKALIDRCASSTKHKGITKQESKELHNLMENWNNKIRLINSNTH